jgi:uncharacterized protein with HEPN domain
MQHETKKYLEDIALAAELIAQFTAGKTLADYMEDPMLRAAVERKFEIIGEALIQLSKRDAVVAGRISEHKRIIAFRNVLIHGYNNVDNLLVWGGWSKASSPHCGATSRRCSPRTDDGGLHRVHGRRSGARLAC